jgi:tryptophan halogenase
MLGQRLEPQRWHRIAALMSDDRLRQALADVAAGVAQGVAAMPGHQQFLDGYYPG